MKPLIVALDVETDKEVMSIIRATRRYVDIYKVGPGLILRYGPGILKKIKSGARKIFLDLKFHDIPTTMVRAIRESARWGVYSATVHTAAGESALKSVSEMSSRPRLWGVTVLTSLSAQDLDEVGFSRGTAEQVTRLAALAKRAALDGVVASVGEAAELRSVLGPRFSIITPGIRLPDGAVGDQKRIATPRRAREAGADFIVVGRPILESKDPARTAEDILRDWQRGGR